MKILTLPVGQMQSNCYLVINEKSQEAIVIDPGDDGDFIIRRIQDEEVKPTLIVATHGHFDHLMAATELKLAFKIPFYIHQNDQSILDRHQSTARYFLGIDVDPPPTVDHYLKDGDMVHVGNEKLTVRETPGHTPGSIYLLSGFALSEVEGSDPETYSPILFCGDLLFAGGGVGRTDLEGGDEKLLYNSIKQKIFTLPDETIIYPGHGEPTTVGQEKKFFTIR